MNIRLFIIHPILQMVLQWNTIWKSNQISVCSFPSRNLRVWKVVPKGPRPTPPLTRAQISDEPDFFQTCGFHHELEKGYMCLHAKNKKNQFSRFWENLEKPRFLPFLALFSKFTFLAITPEEELFWTCGFYQKKPTIKLLLDTKKQNDSTTKTGEIFERLSGNVNSVPFENRILDLDFPAEGVKIV